ncbi:MAG: CCA tRNA nucleotidyltransferase [Acholeplasmatales bacterium]|nr:CCA tRNA nucleotidyltransferase [Acholeplasmatales bacterium]
MIIPDNIKFILNKLNNNGYLAYVVGGCVRDNLLGKNPSDFDVTTSAMPEEIKEVFKDYKIIDNNGEKHGTITVRYNHENIEITTFRYDGEYNDHRHPSEVEFTRNLEEDLKRRDFTINAIAMDINGKIYDYFDGKGDLNKKIVKCVGEPYKRFNEDALRIFRALRFASVLDFEIEENTLEAMYELKETLNFVSRERIRVELDKMICGKAFTKLMRDNRIREVFAQVIPDIKKTFEFNQKSKYHPNDLYIHTLNVVNGVINNYIVKMAALLHDIGKTRCFQSDIKDGKEIYHFIGHQEVSRDMAKDILKGLKYSSDDISKVCFLIEYHDYRFSTNIKSVRKFMKYLPERDSDLLMEYLLSLKHADSIDHTSVTYFDFNIVKENYYKIKNDINECYNMKLLKINGDDLVKCGYSGKVIGEILNDVLDKVINGSIKNDKKELLDFIKKNW